LSGSDKRSSQISQKSRRSVSASGAIAQSSIARTSIRPSRQRQIAEQRGAASTPSVTHFNKPSGGEKPLHSIDDRVQCSAGPHRRDTLIVIREVITADVHRFALRRQQLLRDPALGRRQGGGYRSESLL
jgi:hypothetical protein